MGPTADQQRGMNEAANEEAMSILHDLSQLLNTGLSREQLQACVDLIEGGLPADSIADVIKELRQQAQKLTAPPQP